MHYTIFIHNIQTTQGKEAQSTKKYIRQKPALPTSFDHTRKGYDMLLILLRSHSDQHPCHI